VSTVWRQWILQLLELYFQRKGGNRQSLKSKVFKVVQVSHILHNLPYVGGHLCKA